MNKSVAEKRFTSHLLRSLSLLLSFLVLYLCFYIISYLNNSSYPGFEIVDHQLLVVAENAIPPLSNGDIINAVEGKKIFQPREWRSLLGDISESHKISLKVTSKGKQRNLHISGQDLLSCRLEFQPESTVIQVVTVSASVPIAEGDRVLSVGGTPVKTRNIDKIKKLLSSSEEGVLPIVYLSKGKVKLNLVKKKELQNMAFKFIPKYPVFVTSVLSRSDCTLYPGDQLLNLNGNPVWNSKQATDDLCKLESGQPIIINVQSGNDFRTISTFIQFTKWDQNYSANFFYVICLVFFFILSVFLLFQIKDPHLAVSQSLFSFSLAILLLSDWKIMYPLTPFSETYLIPGLIACPIIITLLLTTFPILLEKIKKLKSLAVLTGLWVVGAAASVLILKVDFQTIVGIVKLLSLMIVFFLLGVSYTTLARTKKTYQRASFTIIYIGMFLGLCIPFTAFAVSALAPQTLMDFVLVLMIFSSLHVPAIILYANVRQRVLYTDLIFKKSLAYTLVSGIILFFYFLIVVRLGKFIHGILEIDNVWIMLIFLILAAFLVGPLKNIVTRLINRLFFQNQISYQEFILESSRQLNYLMDLPSIIDLTLNQICDVAYLSGGYLLLRDPAETLYECKAARRSEVDDFQNITFPADWKIMGWVTDSREPIELSEHRNYKILQGLPEVEKERLQQLRVAVVAPFFSRNELLGLLLLKRKLSGELYTSEDISFLNILCNQAAIALDNAMFREKEKALIHSSHQQKRLALMGQMATNMAHEIRNPLVAIKGLGKLIESSLDEDDKRKNHMKVLNSEVSRLQTVVTELVRFARPTNMKKSEIDLNTVVENSMALYREEFNRGFIDFQFKKHDSPVMIEVDPDKVKQILINMIQNAIEAVPTGGQIVMETTIEGKEDFTDIYSTHAILRICDSGPGIAPELHDKIFEPFFTSKNSGTGLGLAIVKDIMDEHGGSVELINGPDGKHCFELRFPMEARG